MGRGRFSKVVSVLVTGIIAMSGLPCKVLADVINAPTYYSVQSDLNYEITTNITSSWINHESIDLVFTNIGSETIHNWYLTFNTPYNIDNIWNGVLYETDGNGTYTITSNGWNQDIHTGESVTVGITFSSDTEEDLSVDPEWYLLNTQATVVDASQYTLEYTEYSAWETGFTGQLTLTPQVDCQHWELSFGSNREITVVSSAVLISEGENNYAITHDENNMRLFAGTAYNFGIQGVNTEYPLELSNLELTVVDLAYHLTNDEDANGIPNYLEFIGGCSIVDPTPTPTPVPTDDPTETPTTEPTGTETPTPTEEPTPTPIIDYESDQDLDGLPDYIEDQLGTDPLKADTDDDLLTDYIEVMIGYDPTNPDTDNNGVTDGNEDCDNDGLSNAYELNLGTNPVMEDTDSDRLNDGNEVNVYGTDPLVPDSDGDGICDGDEVSMGKNPSDPTDGATRISQSLTQEINNAEDPAITSVTVTADLAGKIDRVLDIRDYYNIDVYSTDVYGRIGSPINFECDEEFDSATIVIHYDETQLGDVLEEDIGVLWFDEENGEYIEQEQAVVDVVNNTITLELSHFSTYVVCSLSKWRNPILPDYSDYLYDARTYEYNIRNMPNVGSLEETEDEAWASFQAENGSNWVRVYTISMYHVSSSSANYYTYRWIIMDNTDTDEDGVPNFIERLGVLGSNHCIYHSNLMKEDSDDDGLRDSDELGNLLIRTSFSYYKPIIIYLIRNANGEIQLLYLDDSVSFDSNDLGPWMTRIVSFGTDPMDPDTDGDYYYDDYDINPIISGLVTVDLGGDSYDVLEEDEGYIHVRYRPYEDIEYDLYYGGHQRWFQYEDYYGLNLFIKRTGCGLIATNDVLLYLNNGVSQYEWGNYRRSVLDTYDAFLDAQAIWGSHIPNSFALSPVFVSRCLEYSGYSNRLLGISERNRQTVLDEISTSIINNHPVILLEDDRVLYYSDFFLSEYNPIDREGFPLYVVNENDVTSFDNLFVPPDDPARMVYHYVTITGIVINNNAQDDADNVYLRVQSWGHEYYINYNDYVNYNESNATCLGEIIIID